MKIDKNSPLHPAEYGPDHVAAVQAMFIGEADSRQQQLILQWIVNQLCLTYDNTIHLGPDGIRESDIAAGRRFVGLTLVKLSKLHLTMMKGKKNV